MNAGTRLAQLFKKNGVKSKPSTVLVLTWTVVLLWYLLDGLPFLAAWPIDEIIVVPILFIVSAYYYGKYNFEKMSTDVADKLKNYQESQNK